MAQRSTGTSRGLGPAHSRPHAAHSWAWLSRLQLRAGEGSLYCRLRIQAGSCPQGTCGWGCSPWGTPRVESAGPPGGFPDSPMGTVSLPGLVARRLRCDPPPCQAAPSGSDSSRSPMEHFPGRRPGRDAFAKSTRAALTSSGSPRREQRRRNSHGGWGTTSKVCTSVQINMYKDLCTTSFTQEYKTRNNLNVCPHMTG